MEEALFLCKKRGSVFIPSASRRIFPSLGEGNEGGAGLWPGPKFSLQRSGRSSGGLCCLPESERYRCAHVPRIDADRPAQFLGGVLHLTETVSTAAIKINAGIPHPDHRTVTLLQGFDMDALVLRAVHYFIQEVPQYEG